MKTIDQFIKQNLADFNDANPPEGHFERFAGKLDDLAAKSNRQFRMMLLRVAALVVFVFLVSLLFFREYRTWEDYSSDAQIISYNQELLEAERYYSGLLSVYYGKIEELKFQNNAGEKRQVLRDLQEMDKQVEMMKEDLRQNPNNELIVHAIISFYQIKIELMDKIIAQVQ
ncbi:MAG: hypothetical protein JXB19_07975 [Bacteroidales bacterium]|nr:hypothetical protein [Bacteroidales bacterium]